MDRCASCDAELRPGAFFLVRVDVLADPSTPPLNTEHLPAYADVVQQLEQVDADEAQDAVHRHFEYPVCPRCQRRILANPLGLPRVQKENTN